MPIATGKSYVKYEEKVSVNLQAWFLSMINKKNFVIHKSLSHAEAKILGKVDQMMSIPTKSLGLPAGRQVQ